MRVPLPGIDAPTDDPRSPMRWIPDQTKRWQWSRDTGDVDRVDEPPTVLPGHEKPSNPPAYPPPKLAHPSGTRLTKLPDKHERDRARVFPEIDSGKP